PHLAAQARAVFAKAAALLEASNLTMSNVVKTVDYTTPSTLRDYKATGAIRKEMLGPVYPAAAGILLSRLLHPDALISLDVIATQDTPVAVNPGWGRYAKLTYAPAVQAAGMLFMSGQAALDPATERAVHAGDVVAQADYTYGNVLQVLRAAGAGPEHLVKTIEYVTPAGLKRYREVAAVRERLLTQPYPASTGCVCEALLRPEFEFEVDPLAILP
ncbi:MAG: RidA family protein, partial [Actinomycetota bacterium]